MAHPRPSILVAAAAALLLGGCATNNSNTDLVAGKQAFVLKCGSCHTLAHAGTKGTVGPDLDQAFREDVREHFGSSAIAGVVRGQIKDPATFPAGHASAENARYPNTVGVSMPAGLASGQEAENIAAYVAHVAGRGGKDTGLLASAVPSATGAKPAAEAGGVLKLAASPTGQLAYTTNKATATAGKVTIAMTNTSGTPHNVAIQVGTGAIGAIVGKTTIEPKGVSTTSVVLKPGTYTYFCQVPGHRAAGMLGTLTVK